MNQPTALVTGGSRGIGLAIVKKLIAAGYNVSTIARNESTDDEFHQLVDSGTVLFLLGDIKDAATRATLVSTTLYKFGQLDLLCHNVGTGPEQRLDILAAAQWRVHFEPGVIAPCELFREHEVMGCHFRRHLDAASLCPAHDIHRSRRGKVAKSQPGTHLMSK